MICSFTNERKSHFQTQVLVHVASHVNALNSHREGCLSQLLNHKIAIRYIRFRFHMNNSFRWAATNPGRVKHWKEEKVNTQPRGIKHRRNGRFMSNCTKKTIHCSWIARIGLPNQSRLNDLRMRKWSRFFLRFTVGWILTINTKWKGNETTNDDSSESWLAGVVLESEGKSYTTLLVLGSGSMIPGDSKRRDSLLFFSRSMELRAVSCESSKSEESDRLDSVWGFSWK